MHRFANPGRFLRMAAIVLPWSAAATILLIGTGLVWGLFFAPPDYQQGESVRIIYVHVPSAWMALFIYTCMAAASASALIWRHPLGDLIARAASPIGACFTFIALVTGSLWGKPMWGAWWVWDARLTSMLILFFLYLGHLALLNAFDDANRGNRAAAILAIVGFINVPIIKFSVDWWNTLHQGESIVSGQIARVFLWPLAFMAFGYMALFASLWMVRIRTEIVNRRARSLMQRAG